MTALPELDILPRSTVESSDNSITFALAELAGERRLVVCARESGDLEGLVGEVSESGAAHLLVGSCCQRNAAELRRRLDWLRPRPQGLAMSVGLGDRLGVCTPGHVRAVHDVGGVSTVFAQQSIREMTRSERTPQSVLDDAMWGMFAEGWRGGTGADADHLKLAEDIDRCVAAGFTMFSIDPGDHVVEAADTARGHELDDLVDAVPWARLDDSAATLRSRYRGRRLDCAGATITFDDETISRAAAKYGAAVAYAAAMHEHLMQRTAGAAVEIEVCVDETASVTSHAEHAYLVSELKRLGVTLTSFAPRYLGMFEKAVEYLGDVAEFERHFGMHAAIARELGPYKLSLHSGSEKFSIYAVARRQAGPLLHLKTAGTSYLEALRVVALVDSQLFNEIYRVSYEHYRAARDSYHVSARLDRAPRPGRLPSPPVEVIGQSDARQILHVGYGAVLTSRTGDGGLGLRPRLTSVLSGNRELLTDQVRQHIAGHLWAFAGRNETAAR